MNNIKLEVLTELNTGSKIGQLRAVPVNLGPDQKPAVLATYCSEFDVDPYHEMFYFPTDTLKMMLFTTDGTVLWKKDLGKGVVPGMWFCPVLAFDLDGDGIDEIWFVNNVNVQHPLAISGYRLDRLDPLTGETTGQWAWPHYGAPQTISHSYRNFIIGGYVREQPVLITAQGTYEDMYLQGWNKGMEKRWEHAIEKFAPGSRGSHMCPVADINNDGIDELMWGERCIELDTGKELFCCDRENYHGHSDMIQPVLDHSTGNWYIYTAREGHNAASPRVLLFNSAGQRVWGDVEKGHMDINKIARIGENREIIGISIKIDHKTCGPDGRFHFGRVEYIYKLLTGEKIELPFSAYGMLPVDVNGDGIHEFVGTGKLLDYKGNTLSEIKGHTALACHFTGHPGEQIMTYSEDGTIRIWTDVNAVDLAVALERYSHPFYKINMKLSSSGSNIHVLAGV